MDKLKPCPFCGGKVEIIEDMEYKGDIGIECQNCFMIFTQSLEKDEMIKAWNRRADNG